ncbi:hypothetical protein [Nocardioides alcanivorans]|uniref:hypothetical protein n=1 Tax=Nocardioides alcanivorans TaxID=2897352 RepID=UPI001F394978|nr:hypothetical protein [Nocardioides alcanivorans]
MGSSVRRSSAAAVAALLTITLAACSDDDATSDDSPSASPSATASTGATDPTGDSTGSVDEPGEPGEGPDSGLPTGDDLDLAEFVTLVRAGMESVTTADVKVVVDFDDEGGDGSGVLDVTGERDALQLNLSDKGSDETASFYFIDGVVFLKEDAESNDKFIRLEPELHDGLNFYALFHPHQLTDFFLREARGVEHLGAEQVGGTDVQHYRLSVDPQAFGKLFGGIMPSDELPESTIQHLWLDPQGRLAKSRVEMAEGDDEYVIETELTGFGDAPVVEEPPASEVDDLSQHGE